MKARGPQRAKRSTTRSPTCFAIPKDGRLGKLLKSDYVFVNGLLATYYGIDGVTGDEFRKIKLPADSPRGGFLGMAAIHAMGSDGVVSSPVERGAWVLRHLLLNDPPPPAPPNVPQMSRLEGQVAHHAPERLRAHQEQAQCASCHRKIDPIGFGLENFNAAGKWRTEDSYQARDGRGRGVGKRKDLDRLTPQEHSTKDQAFNNYHELRDLIVRTRRRPRTRIHRTPDRICFGPSLWLHRRGTGEQNRQFGQKQ